MTRGNGSPPPGLLVYRLAAGLTQRQVADALRVHEDRVRHWDRGERLGRLELRELLALAQLYRVPGAQLVPELLEQRT